MPSLSQRASLALLVLSVAACATVEPLPVKEPTAGEKAADTSNGPLRGLPPPSGVEDGIRTLYAYANTYTAEGEAKLSRSYNASDWALGGALLGMVGGLTKSPEAAIAGATVAGGAGAFSARYSLQAQSANYFGAAEAMECMAGVLTYGQAPTVQPAARVGGNGPRVEDKHLDTSYLNDRINDVRRKLRKNQAAIDTSKVDISALQASVQAQVDAKRAAEEAKKKAQGAAAIAATRMTAATAKDGTVAMNAALRQAADAAIEAAAAELEAEREVIRKALAVCSTSY